MLCVFEMLLPALLFAAFGIHSVLRERCVVVGCSKPKLKRFFRVLARGQDLLRAKLT
jgi:hypothetical protein